MIRYDVNHAKGGRILYFALEAISLILLFGLRYRVGGDSLMYEEEWHNMPSLAELRVQGAFQNLRNQPLYYLLVALIKEFGGGFVLFQIVHAIIVNTVFFKIIKQYCGHIFTAVLFYFFFMSFNSNTEILKESLAISVFLISLKYLLAHKWFPYYICCIIAFNFHVSAIICFILPLIMRVCAKQWHVKDILLYTVLFGLFSAIYVKYLPSFLTYINAIALISTTNVNKMETYTSMLGNSNAVGYLMYLVNVLVILFFSYVMRRNKLTTTMHNITMNMMVVFTSLNMIVPIMGARWSGYFSLLYYICLADMLYSFKVNNGLLKLATIFSFLYITVSVIHSQIAPDPWAPGKIPTYVRYIPYHSVFDKKTEPEREASVHVVYNGI